MTRSVSRPPTRASERSTLDTKSGRSDTSRATCASASSTGSTADPKPHAPRARRCFESLRQGRGPPQLRSQTTFPGRARRRRRTVRTRPGGQGAGPAPGSPCRHSRDRCRPGRRRACAGLAAGPIASAQGSAGFGATPTRRDALDPGAELPQALVDALVALSIWCAAPIVDPPSAQSPARSIAIPARMSGLSIRCPTRRAGPVTTARCGSQRMIRAPITSLSTKNSRLSNIFSKISTVPIAWVGHGQGDRRQSAGKPARARPRSSGCGRRGRPRRSAAARGDVDRRALDLRAHASRSKAGRIETRSFGSTSSIVMSPTSSPRGR